MSYRAVRQAAEKAYAEKMKEKFDKEQALRTRRTQKQIEEDYRQFMAEIHSRS